MPCSQTAGKPETPFEDFSRAAVASVDALVGQVRYRWIGSLDRKATLAVGLGARLD